MNYKNYIIYDSKKNTFFLGNLETADNLIIKVTPGKKFSKPNGMIIPGLINVHAHLGELPFRGGYFGQSLAQYLIGTEAENQVKDYESMRTEISQATLAEMIGMGITTVSGARVGEAARAWNIRSLTLYPLMSSKKLAHYLAGGADAWDLNGYKGLFCHSLLSVNLETLMQVKAAIMANPSLYLQIHIAETEVGAKEAQKIYGMSEVAVLNSLGLLSEKTVLVHCTYCSKSDLDLIAKHKVTVVICPVSNLRLGGKILDIKDYLTKINFCISTDGPGTNDSLDLLAELKYLALFGDIPAKELLPMITLNPAKALGLSREIGSLEVGKQADFVVFDTDSHFFPFRKLHNIIVLNPPTTNIKAVVSHGETIYQKDGGLTDQRLFKQVNQKIIEKYVEDNFN